MVNIVEFGCFKNGNKDVDIVNKIGENNSAVCKGMEYELDVKFPPSKKCSL